MAENYIKTNSMELQCVVQSFYEQDAQSQTKMSPPFPSTSASQAPNPAFMGLFEHGVGVDPLFCLLLGLQLCLRTRGGGEQIG